MTDEKSTLPNTVDFDHRSATFAEDPIPFYDTVLQRDSPPFSPHHEGFWVAARYADTVRIGRDPVTFSSEKDLDGTGRGPQFGGVLIPPWPVAPGVGELDGDEWVAFRRLIAPHLAPNVVEKLRPMISNYATSIMDRFIASGKADLVGEFTGPVPAIVTMEMMGLPLDNWPLWAKAMHAMLALAPGVPGFEEAFAELMRLSDNLLIGIGKRRAELADESEPSTQDMLSNFVTARIDGKPIPDEEVLAHLINVIVGGVDTTTSLTAHALLYLHRNHAAREMLRADPSKIPAACEEFLRYYSPAPAQARTLTADCTIGESAMKEGDRVLICWAASNRDPAAFPDPDEVKLDRSPNHHAAFGLGPHRCPGSHLARVEFEILLAEVLRRIPDYVIDESELQMYRDRGVANGVLSLPATFTPGAVIGKPLAL
jgi:cytochrome P450